MANITRRQLFKTVAAVAAAAALPLQGKKSLERAAVGVFNTARGILWTDGKVQDFMKLVDGEVKTWVRTRQPDNDSYAVSWSAWGAQKSES